MEMQHDEVPEFEKNWHFRLKPHFQEAETT